MPFGGYDPIQPGDNPDPYGSSLNLAEYYAGAPGGRFGGDVWAYLEGLAAMDPAANRTGNTANPNYEAPAWLEHVPGRLGNLIARLTRAHEWNVRNNADRGPMYDPVTGAYQPWSGPSASYGPPGGPLHGTLDQGNDHLQDYDDSGGTTLTQGSTQGDGGGRRGGGKKTPDFGALNFQPYAGVQVNPSFVGMQPIAPFTVDNSPTQFVGGLGRATPAPAAPVVPVPQGPRGGGGTGGGGGRGIGRGGRNAAGGGMRGAEKPLALGGVGSGAGAGGRPPAGTTAGGAAGAGSAADLLNMLFPGLGARVGGNESSLGLGIHRLADERGYDPGYLDRGTPGWVRDPSQGILNTAGFSHATPPPRGMFATDDEYITALHDMGFDNESIVGLLSGWGTGGVVRGDEGYMFANDPRAQESGGAGGFSLFGGSPGSNRAPGGGFSLFGGGGGGGGGIGATHPTAVDLLNTGYNPMRAAF